MGTKIDHDPIAGWSRPSWADWPDDPDEDYVIAEWAACASSPRHFIASYTSIYQAGDRENADSNDYDPTASGGQWVKFELWPSQIKPLRLIHTKRRVILLKARQIGMTWLALAYSLWMLLFQENVTILLFSRGDREALDLLRRLKDMARRLPPWLQPEGMFDAKGRLTGAAGHSWVWPGGSRVMAFPSSAGDSYSATMAVIDEADLVPDLDKLLASVKPTVDSGGKLILISRVDKKKPESPFKRMYRAAEAGNNGFAACFLPWYADPGRTWEFYQAQVQDSLTRMFSMDAVYEQYPQTSVEALLPNQLDKRFPEDRLSLVFKEGVDLCQGGAVLPVVEWFDEEVYADGSEIPYPPPEEHAKDRVKRSATCPVIKGLAIYEMPEPGGSYTLGADPAQGLPGSNNSACVIVDDRTGHEVARVKGKLAPRTFGRITAELTAFYRAPPNAKCTCVIERNNHGHALITWWRDNIAEDLCDASLWCDKDGNPGWNQTGVSKEVMYHRAAQAVSDKRCLIQSRDVYDEVASVEAETLEAPEGQSDDLAVAWGLSMAVSGLKRRLDW